MCAYVCLHACMSDLEVCAGACMLLCVSAECLKAYGLEKQGMGGIHSLMLLLMLLLALLSPLWVMQGIPQ